MPEYVFSAEVAEEIYQIYSDVYKDAHGIRPRWSTIPRDQQELDELVQTIRDLEIVVVEQISHERWMEERMKQQREEDARLEPVFGDSPALPYDEYDI